MTRCGAGALLITPPYLLLSPPPGVHVETGGAAGEPVVPPPGAGAGTTGVPPLGMGPGTTAVPPPEDGNGAAGPGIPVELVPSPEPSVPQVHPVVEPWSLQLSAPPPTDPNGVSLTHLQTMLGPLQTAMVTTLPKTQPVSRSAETL